MKAETDTTKRTLTRQRVMKDYAEMDQHFWGHKAASVGGRFKWVGNEYQPRIIVGPTTVSHTAEFQSK